MVEYSIEAQMILVRFQKEAPSKMFIIKNLSKKFHTTKSFFNFFHKSKKIINNINILSNTNEHFIGIIGPNGCGKSTLLSLISGWITPDIGKIIFKYKNKIFYNHELHTISTICHSKLFINTKLNFFQNIKKDNHEFLINKNLNSFYNLIIKKFVITNKFKVSMSKFSKGMLQKYYITRSLLLNKQINCFDEPLEGLDYTTINNFIKILLIKKQLIKNKQHHYSKFFFTSHNKNFLYSICDSFLYLNKKGSQIKYLKKNQLISCVFIEIKILSYKKINFIEKFLYNFFIQYQDLNFTITKKKLSFQQIIICCEVFNKHNIINYSIFSNLFKNFFQFKEAQIIKFSNNFQ